MRGSLIGKQYPKGLDKRGNPRTRAIVQAGANRVQTERRRVNPGNTGKNQNTRKQTIQLSGFRIAAKTRRVINAEQYWNKTETQNGSVRQLTLGAIRRTILSGEGEEVQGCIRNHPLYPLFALVHYLRGQPF